MDIRILATLPRFSIEGEELILPEARLLKISFDEILEFEVQQNSADYDKQRSRYNYNPPVFFEKWIEVPDEILNMEVKTFIRELGKIATPYINTCVCAIHFYTGVPILSPFLSTIYFDYRSDINSQKKPSLIEQFTNIGAYRAYGESDKEYTLFNESPIIHISRGEHESFGKFYRFIDSKSIILQHNELQSVIEPTQVLALPGINYNIQLILLTSALEAFLIPEITTKISEQFRKRFANLCQLQGEKEKLFLNLTYKLRSELIHGNSIRKLFEKLPFNANAFLKTLTLCTIVGFCKFLHYVKINDEIESQLETFRQILSYDENDTRLTELLASSDYSRINDLTHQWSLKK